MAALLLGACGAHAASEIKLAAGTAIGASSEGVLTLKGVPYAAAPTGARRWEAPQAVEPWTAARDALEFGPSCPQLRPPRYVTPGTAAADTNEDCLTVNVWAPQPAGSALPVVVWIHGGGNVGGTASQTFYDGSSFARDGIVFVSFNYRLGLLGFFAHPDLAPKGQPAPANFALLDQVAALRWVQSNIRAVGGDSANVTVMGESAGAQDILALLCMPVARGLFARAIVQSAGIGWDSPPSLNDAQIRGGAVATALGLEGTKATAAQLRGASVADLLEAQRHEDPGPIVDRATLYGTPLRLLATREAAHVPLLIGTDEDEASEVLSEPTDPPAPATLFPRLSASQMAALRSVYGPAAAQDRPFSRLLIRDGFFAAPARLIAGANSRFAPTFLYRFDYVSSVFHGHRPGAAHGSEIPFIFQTGKSSRASAVDVEVSAQLHGYWASFIRSGVPSQGDTVWPAYDPARDETLVFAQHPRLVATPDAPALDLLRSQLFPDVARRAL